MSKEFENLFERAFYTPQIRHITINTPYHKIDTKEDYLAWLKQWKHDYNKITKMSKELKRARKPSYWADKLLDKNMQYYLEAFRKANPEVGNSLVDMLAHRAWHEAQWLKWHARAMLRIRQNYKYASAFLRKR